MMSYMAVIVGGGPGGYTCAIRLAQLGAKVAVVERGPLGGVCTNSGCIPVKSLHASVKILREIRVAQKHGIICPEASVDYPAMRKRALSVASLSGRGVELLFKKFGVDLLRGVAKIKSRSEVEVNDQQLRTENVVIATGSEPIPIPGVPFSERVLSSESLLAQEKLPKSLAVVGGGYIGVEYASIFSSLGVKVSIVEMMDRLLPGMDTEIVAILQRNLERDGVDIHLSTKVERLSDHGVIAGGGEIAAEKVLVAIGRRPSFDKVELGHLGVKFERGIATDERMRTSIAGIWAVGDCVGRGMLAHVASHEGIVAAENIIGRETQMDYSAVPSCVFTFPEIATVGTDALASSEIPKHVKVGRFPFQASGKARAMGQTDGLIKVYSRDGVFTGATIIGPGASDLIGEACIAVRNRMKVPDITETIHPHPVLSEAFVEACLDLTGSSLHK